MANNGQTINDRILAARHSIAGQGLAKAVCKATTEELIGPKKKHLDYLLHCTEEPNVSIPSLANLLIERTQSTNWIVVFKGLVTIHHLMCYGNERFVQYLASSNANFQLSSFLDKSGGVQGYDMSPFIRRYAKYLSEKAISYRTVAFDFCKVKRGKDGGTLRSMNTDKLLKTIPTLQSQVDALVDFEVTTSDLNNGVINSSFMLLFRDLIRLFACYNDGIINLLEKYFDMNKKHARDALDIYKKFLIRMDRVADFLKVAENVGIEKGDLPDLAKAPSSLLEALESHLASLEGRKPGSAVTTPTGASRVNVDAAVNVLSSTSSSFGAATQIDEKLQQQLMAEEEQAMAKYKEQHKATNPFMSVSDAPAAAASSSTDNGGTPNILDLFGVPAPTNVNNAAANGNSKMSDDLLQLSGGNPFASVLNAAGNGAQQPPQAQAQNPAFNSSPFGNQFDGGARSANGFAQQVVFPVTSSGTPVLSPASGSQFATESNFRNAFGGTYNNVQKSNTDVGASFFGDILQPQGSGNTFGGAANTSSSTSSSAAAAANSSTAGAKVITGDLDSSLANLTSSLNLGAGQAKNLSCIQQPKGPPIGTGMNNNPSMQTQSNMNSSNGWTGLTPTQSPMSLFPPCSSSSSSSSPAPPTSLSSPAFDTFGLL